jgi:hypothetical protein
VILGSNQGLPLCKLGQGFPSGVDFVEASRLSIRFSLFSACPPFCYVRVCPAPVAARLHHSVQVQRPRLGAPLSLSQLTHQTARPSVPERTSKRSSRRGWMWSGPVVQPGSPIQSTWSSSPFVSRAVFRNTVRNPVTGLTSSSPALAMPSPPVPPSVSIFLQPVASRLCFDRDNPITASARPSRHGARW